jgi:predicted dehydrogenase
MITQSKLYDWITHINPLKFKNKSVLIIGSGNISKNYADVLSKLDIEDVTILSNSKKKVEDLCQKFNFNSLSGGFEKHLPNLKKMDLTIIATPIELLAPAAKLALKYNQNTILIEKPGSFHNSDLLQLKQKEKSNTIRIAYNRIIYPNFIKLKMLLEKDPPTSCKFSMTERPMTIDFTSKTTETYERWGISNTLHVISMVVELIGFPKELSASQSGGLDWHPSGSIFVGSGISEKNVPFSYHGDWSSWGGWSIEIMTKNRVYLLKPLENLFVMEKGSNEWKKMDFKISFPDTKQGLLEETAIMLSCNKTLADNLISLDKAILLNNLAKKIFGYYRNLKYKK